MVDGWFIPIWIGSTILGVLAGCLISKRLLKEYSELLKVADEELQSKTEKIEMLIHEVGQKDVIIERSTQLMDVSREKIDRLAVNLTQLVREKTDLQTKLDFQNSQYEKLLGQKKSSEVRTGKITEQIAPFLSDYPEDPATARFIGDPIDFVHFGQEQVTFVEVKSGKSQLNKNQRRIRDLIKEGKVGFKIYRVEGE